MYFRFKCNKFVFLFNFYKLINMSAIANTAIIGIGNPLLTDDALGLMVVNSIQKTMTSEYAPGTSCFIQFKENYSGGMDLLDEMIGYKRVVIIDSLETDEYEPGTCLCFNLDNLDNFTPATSHGLTLQGLWEIGEKLDLSLPEECLIIGIVAFDCHSFKENLSNPLRILFNSITEDVKRIIEQWLLF